MIAVDCCLVAALQGAALTAGGFIQPTYIADPSAAAAAAAAAAGTGLRYPSPLLSTVVATSNGLQYAMYVATVFLIVKLTICCFCETCCVSCIGLPFMHAIFELLITVAIILIEIK